MFNFDIFNQSKSLNVFNNLKVNKANNNLTSLINFSVIINVHEHPLQLCYPLARKNYGTGWTCDKCSTSFTYDEPSFYCTFCDLDICQKCIGEFRFNEINIYDTTSNNYKYEQRISNGNFQWQKSSPFHNHLLTYIQRGNNSSWICDKCSKKFQSKDPSFYCSLCDFDICQTCFNNNNSNNPNLFNDNKPNLFNDNKPNLFNDNKSNLFNDNKQNLFNDNKSNLFTDNKPNLFNDNKPILFTDNKPNLFNDNKSNLFDDNKQNLFNDNKQSLFNKNTLNLFNDNKQNLFNDNKQSLFY